MNKIRLRAKCHFVDSRLGSISRRSVFVAEAADAERLKELGLVEDVDVGQPPADEEKTQPEAILPAGEAVADESAPAPAPAPASKKAKKG